jgi:quercetin dioxygenase-like cupin family protein
LKRAEVRFICCASLGGQSTTQHLLGLSVDEGEQFVHFRNQSKIMIKAGSATGSSNLALGTQQVKVGAGIPVHRHFQMDEAFYILEGSGILILNDAHHHFEKGTVIFIPKTLGMDSRIPITNCACSGS